MKRLIHDAVDATTHLVDDGHESAARSAVRFASWIRPLARPARDLDDVRRVATRGVLGAVRTVNRAVEAVTDAGIAAIDPEQRTEAPVPLRADAVGSAAWVGDALLGAVNGVVGDHLHGTGNGLDLGMALRADDRWLEAGDAVPRASRRLVVLVHGLATTEWSFAFGADTRLGAPDATFGSLLQRDLGFTPVFARYNTGRRIADNGLLLARRIASLVERWPGDLDEIVLLGHSMGGLVARTAAERGRSTGAPWVDRLTRVVCLGSPHDGAPLERFGHLAERALGFVDLPGTRIPAAIVGARSAGIQDLRYGLGDAPLVDGVRYAFLAGTVTTDPGHPVARVLGDLLVLAPSAEGRQTRRGTFPLRTARFGGVRHHELMVDPDVYAQVRRFCAGELDPE